MGRSSTHGRAQSEAVFEVLRAAEGRTVEPRALYAAMYPGDAPWPSSCETRLAVVAERLRDAGHDVRGYASTGFRLLSCGPASTRKERRCLGGCREMFMSDGPGHRICPRCTTLESRRDAVATFSLSGRP